MIEPPRLSIGQAMLDAPDRRLAGIRASIRARSPPGARSICCHGPVPHRHRQAGRTLAQINPGLLKQIGAVAT
ncbi:hypothetical protein [uncultured Sphingomonas sp.]|uniref:hypothetical protein n=1 Tax=uncultured Sphingomonas sp. TaxID=158754 RepID=UPI0035CBC811